MDIGVANLASPSEKPETVRLVLQISNRLAFDNCNVSNPEDGFFFGLPATGRDQRVLIATKSVSTNKLENAGCASSVA